MGQDHRVYHVIERKTLDVTVSERDRITDELHHGKRKFD